MALQKCSSRQDYQDTFERVVLPSSNKLIEISNGSIRFTVEAEKLAALKELWDIYKDGTLQSRLQEFLVTDAIKQLGNGEDIEVTVFIDEHEYKEAYFNLFLLHQAPNVEQEERAGRRTRRNSDSFLCCKPNENEIALMKLMEETEEKWRKEKQILEVRIAELEETLKAERTSNLDQTTILGRPSERRRRNSDSDLYYKARKGEVEQTANEPERAFEDGAEMDLDKRMFVENYVQNIHETHSMTTETSDSGIRTHGLTSEIEMQDISDDDRKLCLKDLNKDAIRKLRVRLMSDEAAREQIRQSFGIDYPGMSSKMKGDTGIFFMFPDTPVKVLREVFEALQLYDLIDLLEEEKPRITRSLRPALPLQDIEKLRNPGDRPLSYHSSVAVLIILSSETSDTVGIEKFFKGLNTKSEVTVMPYKKYDSLDEEKEALEFKKAELLFQQSEWKVRSRKKLRELEKKSKEREEKLREMEEKSKEMEEKLREIEEKLKEIEGAQDTERNKCTSIISEVIQSWISNQDEFSLFAVFFIYDRFVTWNSPVRPLYDDVMERLVTAFPTKVKLVIHQKWHWRLLPVEKPHKEIVEVFVDFSGDDFLTLMLEIFTKRWQTMDLISMMRELKRALAERQVERRDLGIPRRRRKVPSISAIKENLSCLLRFVNA